MPTIHTFRSTVLLVAVSAALLLAAPVADANPVIDWNAQLLDAVRAERTNPPRATRTMALLNVSIFDAVNGLGGGYGAYAVAGPGPAGAAPEAAAAAAAHEILSALYPDRGAIFDAALEASLDAVPGGPARDAGEAWGRQVAEEVLALREDDGADAVLPYESVYGAGWWVPTGPAFAPALLPNWAYVRPWAVDSVLPFRQPAPPPLRSAEYAAAFEEVARLGRSDSAERTPDQSEIAVFWDDGPGTNTPPGHWNQILQGLARDQGLSLLESARLFALHGLTVADAAIVAWDNKYYWDHWRPVTGIRQADLDGNDETRPDPGWTSYITNPPFPAYTSGHSTFSSSSARIAALFFGRDDLPFSAGSDGAPGVVRSWDGLWQAALEAGWSRIYGGIHWQYDNQGGLGSGRRLAEEVFYGTLRPSADVLAECDPGAGHLCLLGGRFAVTARWRTASDSGTGTPVALPEGGGYFWFFQPANPEVTVKVLDGCAAFGHFWVFASGLTNLEVELRVVDTHAGIARTWFSPGGESFRTIQDTAAFATCP